MRKFVAILLALALLGAGAAPTALATNDIPGTGWEIE